MTERPVELAPVEVPGYIIPYLVKECAGISALREGEAFTEIRIETTSVLGMFLTRTLRPDYKVKFYQLTLYCRKIGHQTAFSSEIREFKNNAEFQIDLSFADLENFYRFLDTIFNATFYFYLSGYCDGSQSRHKIKEGINRFCAKYDLLEYGYNENQMRLLYYTYRCGRKERDPGALTPFSNNKSFSVNRFLQR